ncbi:MAG: hypothetical protein ACXWWH_12035 [Nitrospira sp.]
MALLDGFTAFDGTTDSMKDLKVEVLDHGLARGFYRWPTAWRITWTGPQGPATLNLKQVTRTSIWNLAFSGFSMAVVQGELSLAGKQQEVYGLVELIMESIFFDGTCATTHYGAGPLMLWAWRPKYILL